MSMVTVHGMMASAGKELSRPLPLPLDYPSLCSAILELGVGMRKAVETCLECWKNNRLSDSDFVSFLRSIKSQSSTLSSKFALPSAVLTQVATADDMAELRALAGLSGSSISVNQPRFSSSQASFPSIPIMKVECAQPPIEPARFAPNGGMASQSQPALVVGGKASTPQQTKSPGRTRRPKNGAPTSEEQMLMEQWRTRRGAEVLRRQLESSEGRTTESYLRFVLESLRRELPFAGRVSLLDGLRSYRGGAISEAQLGDIARGLVDQYSVIVRLEFTPEFKVRQPSQRKLRFDFAELEEVDGVQVCVGEEEECVDEPSSSSLRSSTFNRFSPVESVDKIISAYGCDREASFEHVEGGEQPAGFKRKRCNEPALSAQRCTSGGVMVAGAAPSQADDENAVCPVCSGPDGVQAVDDDRWVKCDGCASWYHQICVLFNEPAHGKSVRFFCRTPGCRKRGSRQLNRRMRKPCYPTSPGLETTAVGDYLTAAASAASRQDRQVIVKTVASRSSADGDRRRRTIMAFQHTLTGSDLLFFAIFVEEFRGRNRFSIADIDSNGYYEEATVGERVRVEGAIMHALFQHARESGYTAFRVNLSSLLAPSHGTTSASTGIFHNRPANMGWSTLPVAVSELGTVLQQAVERGILASVVAPTNARVSPVFTGRFAVLNGAQGHMNAGQAADVSEPDLPCALAACREDLLSFFHAGVYRFDTLQGAKFSSMMLVYHLSKGWKKDPQAGRCGSSAACGSTGRLSLLVGEDCEECEEGVVSNDVSGSTEVKGLDSDRSAACKIPETKLSIWSDQNELNAHVKVEDENEDSTVHKTVFNVCNAGRTDASSAVFPFEFGMEMEESKPKDEGQQYHSFDGLIPSSTLNSGSGCSYVDVHNGHLGEGSFSSDVSSRDFLSMVECTSRKCSPMVSAGAWLAKVPALTSSEWICGRGHGWNSNWESTIAMTSDAGGNAAPSSPPLEWFNGNGGAEHPASGNTMDGLPVRSTAEPLQVPSSTSDSSRSASASPRCTFRGFSPEADSAAAGSDPFWDAICAQV